MTQRVGKKSLEAIENECGYRYKVYFLTFHTFYTKKLLNFENILDFGSKIFAITPLQNHRVDNK